MTKDTVKQLSAEIAALFKQDEENHKLADLVLIEIKAVFAGSLAKIKTTQDIAQQPLPIYKQTKLREVKIPTTEQGKGNTYAHPAKPDFYNPITTVLDYTKNFSGKGCNTFETADGKVGEGLGNGVDPVRIPINPVKSEISKI